VLQPRQREKLAQWRYPSVLQLNACEIALPREAMRVQKQFRAPPSSPPVMSRNGLRRLRAKLRDPIPFHQRHVRHDDRKVVHVVIPFCRPAGTVVRLKRAMRNTLLMSLIAARFTREPYGSIRRTTRDEHNGSTYPLMPHMEDRHTGTSGPCHNLASARDVALTSQDEALPAVSQLNVCRCELKRFCRDGITPAKQKRPAGSQGVIGGEEPGGVPSSWQNLRRRLETRYYTLRLSIFPPHV
jgi:hypothetical protein